MKGEWSSRAATHSSEHSAQMTAERERALQTQAEAQARHEQERREQDQSHTAKVSCNRISS